MSFFMAEPSLPAYTSQITTSCGSWHMRKTYLTRHCVISYPWHGDILWQANDAGVCEEVDECADPDLNKCDENAECTNQPGFYECDCNEGFTGNGFLCFRKKFEFVFSHSQPGFLHLLDFMISKWNFFCYTAWKPQQGKTITNLFLSASKDFNLWCKCLFHYTIIRLAADADYWEVHRSHI